MLHRSKNIFISFIDFFYFPIFRKFLPLQTFRYAVCGGGTAFLNLVIYSLAYNFLFKEEVIVFKGLAITGYIAAFIFAFCITFPLGFLLNKFVVFQKSSLRGRVQLFRYALVTASSILGNYLLLHFFVGVCGFWATPSQAITTVLLALFSYFGQHYFSFRAKK